LRSPRDVAGALMRRHERDRRQRSPEETMLRTAVLCLVAFGAVMVYSASSGTSALNGGGNGAQYLQRYLISAVIGFAAMSYFAKNGMEAAKRFTPILLIVAFGGLFLVLVPGFGIEVNGAKRWIGAGPLQIQPSELAKLGLVLYAALLIASKPARTRTLIGVRPLIVMAAGMAALIGLEPDMGTAIVITLTLGALLVVSGVAPRHLALLVGSLIVVGFLFAMLEPYRRARLTAFLNPWQDATGSGFQSVQAQIAIGSGGLFGVGIGESVQKLFYLPEAHSDFILSSIGEELGFVGVAAVLALYVVVLWRGTRAALRARDAFGTYLAAGLTTMFALQAAVNAGVVLGVLPAKGLTLPFVSYGGTSLVVSLFFAGILLDISRGLPAPVRVAAAAGPAHAHLDNRRRRRRVRVLV